MWSKRLAAALIAVLLMSIPVLVRVGTRGERLAGRIYIDGLAMGGWTRQRAEDVLRHRAAAYLGEPILLYHANRTWRLPPRTLGLAIDWHSPVTRAMAADRHGWLGARILAVTGLRRPLRLNLSVRLPQPRLIKTLAVRVAPEVARTPRNALYDPATGSVTSGVPGTKIDLDRTAANISRAVLSKSDRRARLILVMIPPATSAADLTHVQLRHVLASYVTDLSGSPPERLANIKLGAARLNGTLVRPGRTFSFNETLGPRDEAQGYHRAPEIIRQELVPGFGGGICQVATTLYNTVLLAGLPIVDRTCHSLPPGYVPLGRDATVYYPSIDLRFTNPTRGNLMILAAVNGGSLRLSLLAEKPRTGNIWVVSQVLAKLAPPLVAPNDPRATKNKDGAPGYHVRVSRFYGDPERPAKVEIISDDIYYPVPRVKEPAATAGRPPEEDEVDETDAGTETLPTRSDFATDTRPWSAE